MRKIEFTLSKDGEFYIGHINDYPAYETQGYWIDELVENLIDLRADLESGKVPHMIISDQPVLTI